MYTRAVVPKLENRDYYDQFAAWYENERGHGYHRMLDDLETEVVRRYGEDKDLLEVGCGTGLILGRAREFARRAVGIDLSGGMLAKAASRGLEVAQGSATELPIASASVDVAYSFKVLAHVPDIRSAMAEMGDEFKVSVNDILLKSIAIALSQHPEVNAHWLGDHIRYFNRVHLGMAVATDDGLIVPVVWDADRKSLRDISREAKELAKRARDRKLKPEEFTGSTFSVSNLGMFGIDQFTAIITPPEAGILAIGTSEEKLVVVNGEPVVRNRVRVTMSCDHRIIDGAVGAKFLQTLRRLIENPLMLVY